jgi:hypothetical protein
MTTNVNTNPFDDDPVVTVVRSSNSNSKHLSRSAVAASRVRSKEPAIWAARNVEWPLPTTISLSHYQKLLQKQGQEADSFSGWMRSVLPGTTTTPSKTQEGGSRPLKTPRCVATANGWIVAALECAGTAGPRLVSRWNVRRPTINDHNILCVPPPKDTDTDDSTILHIFGDPTGCHTVLSAKNGELYYLHSSSKTIVALQGFGPNATPTGTIASSAATTKDATLQTGLSAGSYVTAIAWDRQRGTEGNTKTILLGTNIGEIYEYSLSNDPTEVELPTLLHRVAASICGFYFERAATGLAILVATSSSHSTRLHSFFSQDTSFRTAFASPQLIELPGTTANTELHVSNDSSFGLLTTTGMYYGTLLGDKIVQAGMIPYDKVPLSMALTPHHVIFLYDSQVVFYNRVSRRIIQKERVDWSSSEDSSQLLMDIRRPDQVWLRKARSLVHISSTMEDRDVWKFTLQKCLEDIPLMHREEDALAKKEALFEYAKSLCTNTVQKAIVTYVRAEYHLSQNRPTLAAKYWAQCPPQLAPFANTALRLESQALIAYLGDKMRAVKLSDDLVLSTMLGAWLTELHLHEREHGSSTNSNLQVFLSNNGSQLDAKTVLRILSSHDVSAIECADYAAASGDLGTAVQTALGKDGAAFDALRILNEAPLHAAEPYYYRYASVLLARAPLAASKSFLSRYSQGLSPAKLLPSLMDYERKRVDFRIAQELRGKKVEGPAIKTTEIMEDDDDLQHLRVTGTKTVTDSGVINGGVEVHIEHHASFVDDYSASIKYLEGVIKLGCRSSAVYSYLISLYVAMDDEEPLLKFLRTHVPAAATAAEVTKKALLTNTSGNLHQFEDSLSSSPLDMSYALRTILSTGRHFRSAIRLYMGFGLRQQAVELALKVDPTLARELAHEATVDDERKRLWLMIARNAAGDRGGGKDVVANVVSVLKDCGPDVLSIEDVLPFL